MILEGHPPLAADSIERSGQFRPKKRWSQRIEKVCTGKLVYVKGEVFAYVGSIQNLKDLKA